MKFNSLQSKNTRKMEKGEELLGKVYCPRVVAGKRAILAGVDGGSTQTRVVLIDNTDDLDELENLRVIPSIYSTIEGSEEVVAKSDVLYDVLDSNITNTIASPNNIFDKVRVVRGTKLVDANKGSIKLNSSIQKIDSPVFYVNIIDALAVALVTKYSDNLCEEYDVYAGVSLPPDNLVSSKNKQKFLNRLQGTFIWENKDLGVKLTINIKGITVQTEPEANIKAYFAGEQEIPELVFCLEGGGATLGTEILRNGLSVTSAARTFEYGGTHLQKLLGQEYVEAEGGRMPAQSQLKEALETGVIKVGRETKDVVSHIMTAKSSLANRIVADINDKVFDGQDNITIDQLHYFFFTGQLFEGGEFKKPENPVPGTEYISSYSLMQPIVEKLQSLAPSTAFKRISDNLIPKGNFLNALNDFGGYVFTEGVADEVEESPALDEVASTVEEEVVAQDSQV